MSVFRGIVFLFCFIFLSGIVTSENEMDFKLPDNLKVEINKYVSGIVGQLTEKYENRIKSLEQRITVLESNEHHPHQDKQNGPARTGHDQDGQDSANIDQGDAVVSLTQSDGALWIGNNQVGQNGIDIQPGTEAAPVNELLKSANPAKVTEYTQHSSRRRNSSFKQQNVPGIVHPEFLSRDSRQVQTKVAFFATLTNQLDNMRAYQDIPFDNVVTNVGNGYNSLHGTFIAPVSGVYVFGVILRQNTDISYGQFFVNGNVIARIQVKSQSSMLIVVHLQQGDDVYVKNMLPGGAIYGYNYSAFSGFLLYQ